MLPVPRICCCWGSDLERWASRMAKANPLNKRTSNIAKAHCMAWDAELCFIWFHLASHRSNQQWSARSAKRSLRLLSDMKPPWQRKNAVCVSMFAFHVGVVMYHNVSVSFHEFSIGLPSIYGSTNVATTHIAPERSERMRSIKMVFHHLEFMGNSWSHLSFRLEANREHVCNV